MSVRVEVERLYGALVAMHRRLEVQSREVLRQEDKVATLAVRLQSLVGGERERCTRLSGLRGRQEGLVARAHALMHHLVAGRAPALSDAERRYLAELARTDRLLLPGTPGGLCARREHVCPYRFTRVLIV